MTQRMGAWRAACWYRRCRCCSGPRHTRASTRATSIRAETVTTFRASPPMSYSTIPNGCFMTSGAGWEPTNQNVGTGWCGDAYGVQRNGLPIQHRDGGSPLPRNVVLDPRFVCAGVIDHGRFSGSIRSMDRSKESTPIRWGRKPGRPDYSWRPVLAAVPFRILPGWLHRPGAVPGNRSWRTFPWITSTTFRTRLGRSSLGRLAEPTLTERPSTA